MMNLAKLFAAIKPSFSNKLINTMPALGNQFLRSCSTSDKLGPQVTFFIQEDTSFSNPNEKIEVPRYKITGREGEKILDILNRYRNIVGPDYGSCEGNVTCSTCHVKIPKEIYETLPDPEEKERDLLEITIGVDFAESRLGCCVKLAANMEGSVMRVMTMGMDAGN